MSNSTAAQNSTDYQYPDQIPAGLTPFQTWISFVTMLIPTVVGSVLYTLIFAAIFKNRKQFSSPFYKYFVSVGIAEILWLQYYGTFACVCIAYDVCPISQTANRIITTIGGWLTFWVEVTGDSVIALDRLVAVCFFKHYETIFTKRRSTILAVLLWLIGFLLILPVAVWITPSSYYVGDLTNWYDISNNQVNLYNSFQTGIQFAQVAFCILAYTTCVLFLVWRRKSTGGGQGAGTRRAQRNLMIQGGLHFSFLFLSDLTYVMMNWYYSFWLSYASTAIMQLIPVVITVMTLCMNEQIRAAVKALFGRNGRKNPTPLMVSQQRLNSHLEKRGTAQTAATIAIVDI